VPGIHLLIKAFTQPGDKVILQQPVYYPFFQAIKRNDCHIVNNPLKLGPEGYVMDYPDLEQKAADPRTKVLILCSPHNPVGRVWTRDELLQLGEICLRHGVLVIADEIHSDLIYPGHTHVPMATLSPEVAQSTVTLMAPSKTYNIAGLECGYTIIQNRELRRRWQDTSYAIVPGVNALGYVAALAALREGQDWLTQVMTYLEGNRNYLQQYLVEKIPMIQMCRMEATYLAWLDCRQSPMAAGPGEFFLRNGRVALNDGADFGRAGNGYVRLNFACPRKILTEALDRMTAAVNGTGLNHP
jgi:cystathionine beta-lyase